MKYPQLVSMPSAVSDWLEEQLEARGIDAVLYTRYVLSLLHSHTVDVIYPDEDLQFSRLKKEVRRSAGGRKCFRRSSEWWRHVQADAEQIKRSAAVECLMSASDQNCEIESLVDELCEKLRQAAAQSPSTSSRPSDPEADLKQNKIALQEPAERYYAAFPPLRPRAPPPARLVASLLPRWGPVVGGSPSRKRAIRKPGGRQAIYEGKLHSKVDGDTMKARNQNKQRYGYFGRNKNMVCRSRGVECTDNLNNWELCMFNNNNKKLDVLEKCDPPLPDPSHDPWASVDEDMNMYDDLPVDIKDLLDSPAPQVDAVELMNMANMRDNGRRGFIPYGTNIFSSIWSNDQDVSFDNKFNTSVDTTDSESTLDLKFSSISIDNQTEPWGAFTCISENEANCFFENGQDSQSFFSNSLPGEWAQPETKVECFGNEHMLNFLAVSLMKLNHNKENSSFAEILPRPQPVSKAFNPFSRPASSKFGAGPKRSLVFEMENDDLFTSESSHFKPINEKMESLYEGQYADGATFLISNSLDKVEYKRSESGSMLLENEYGQSKKYYQYTFNTRPSRNMEFVLKFSICQNDKACQTEEPSDVEIETIEDKMVPAKFGSPETPVEEYTCNCPSDILTAKSPDHSMRCPVHPPRPESVLGEILWKYETKTCEKCNNGDVAWETDWLRTDQEDSDWDSRRMRNIWNGGEICEACLSLNGDPRPPISLQHTRLREDVSQDGEQLLSDLSSLHRSYAEGLPPAEVSRDISELVQTAAYADVERKRRHSLMSGVDDNRDSWSFASRLEEDCLIQMSALPTLRSVTL